MTTKKTTSFVLNTAFVVKDEKAERVKTKAYIGDPDNQGEAVFVTRVDDAYLSDEQTAKIREIHERNAAEIHSILGWE
jgi:hypothetical protein